MFVVGNGNRNDGMCRAHSIDGCSFPKAFFPEFFMDEHEHSRSIGAGERKGAYVRGVVARSDWSKKVCTPPRSNNEALFGSTRGNP
jgi:hypothetical protein